MKAAEAQQLILEKLDEVQQILDLYDPEVMGKVFTAVIERSRKYSRIAFNYLTEYSEPLLEYDEED